MPDLGNPETKIETQAQAIACIDEICARIEQCRNTKQVTIPNNPAATAEIRRKAEQHWLMTYGQAIGTASAFRQCGRLSQNPYNVFRRKIIEVFMGEGAILPVLPEVIPAVPLTPDELIRYLDGLCGSVVRYRDQCNILIPDDPKTTAKVQWEAYERWNVYFGQAQGTLIAYYQCNKIEDNAYIMLKQKVQTTLASRVVGQVSGTIHPKGVMPLVP